MTPQVVRTRLLLVDQVVVGADSASFTTRNIELLFNLIVFFGVSTGIILVLRVQVFEVVSGGLGWRALNFIVVGGLPVGVVVLLAVSRAHFQFVVVLVDQVGHDEVAGFLALRYSTATYVL